MTLGLFLGVVGFFVFAYVVMWAIMLGMGRSLQK